MATLFGKEYTRSELLRHVGDMRQLGEVRISELCDGPGRGVRIADFKNSSGLSFTVLVDRGLDIGAASLNGVPLAWQSGTGITHPVQFIDRNKSWLRGFHGGLLVTCGLTNVGPGGKDELGAYGMHGRLSYTPATVRSYGGEWKEDQYCLFLEGTVLEAAVFGFNLRLSRRIETCLGSPAVTITDTVENLGTVSAPFMLLYHCNFGFPLVADGSEIWVSERFVSPRDPVAEAGLLNHAHCEAPAADYSEQVFFYDVGANKDGIVTAAIVNLSLGLAGTISYRKKELPNLIQWKQMGHGTYAIGLEPANCLPLGRATERKRGTLQTLEPGEKQSLWLELAASRDEAGLQKLLEVIQPGNSKP